MPRQPRIDAPGLISHVINRGVKRLPLFHDDFDRQTFLKLLIQTQQIYPFIFHAYCLMTNHFHLLLQPLEASLGRIMGHVLHRYSIRFNRRYGHVGHAFQARFHNIPVEEDRYMKVVSRYIHLNPVRAGMVKRPENYAWSDYRVAIAGISSITDPRFILGYFGLEPERQRIAYRRFVEDGIAQHEPITESTLLRMRTWGNPLLLKPVKK